MFFVMTNKQKRKYTRMGEGEAITQNNLKYKKIQKTFRQL